MPNANELNAIFLHEQGVWVRHRIFRLLQGVPVITMHSVPKYLYLLQIQRMADLGLPSV